MLLPSIFTLLPWGLLCSHLWIMRYCRACILCLFQNRKFTLLEAGSQGLLRSPHFYTIDFQVSDYENNECLCQEPEKQSVGKAKEKMKIAQEDTYWRGKWSFGYFNIKSFAFNSIGRAPMVPQIPLCRVELESHPAPFKDLVVEEGPQGCCFLELGPPPWGLLEWGPSLINIWGLWWR